jgi:hypothetical protein
MSPVLRVVACGDPRLRKLLRAASRRTSKLRLCSRVNALLLLESAPACNEAPLFCGESAAELYSASDPESSAQSTNCALLHPPFHAPATESVAKLAAPKTSAAHQAVAAVAVTIHAVAHQTADVRRYVHQ